jgi:hypothetical protein
MLKSLSKTAADLNRVTGDDSASVEKGGFVKRKKNSTLQPRVNAGSADSSKAVNDAELHHLLREVSVTFEQAIRVKSRCLEEIEELRLNMEKIRQRWNITTQPRANKVWISD